MPPSRFGLIGDVHAEHQRLEIALDVLRQAGAEALLCSGDIVDGRGDVSRCCAQLRDAEILTVRGNHDRWFLEDRMRDLPFATQAGDVDAAGLEVLGALPTTRTVATDGGALLLCHGLGDNDLARLRPDDEGYALNANHELHAIIEGDAPPAFVVAGHTHRQMLRQLGPAVFINAGTLVPSAEGDPRFGQDDGFALLDLTARVVTFFRFDGDTPRPEGPPRPIPSPGL